ncbi:MAG: NnrU family protein [Pseudomonadota bacterium]
MFMLLGLIIFFGAHFFTAFARGPRDALISRLGEGGYKGAYSVVSLIGFVLIIRGWGAADQTALYVTPYFLRHVVFLLTLLSLICLAAAYLPKGRIAPALKHPMLAGVKLWAFAHLLVNGEVRSVLLFGSFLAFAVIDRIAVKRRAAPTPAPGPAMNDAIVIAVAIAAWAAIYLYLHPIIAGVALRA